MSKILNRKEDLIGRFNALLSESQEDRQDQGTYLNALSTVLEMTIFFSEEHPTAALEVMWHMIDCIPAAFDKGSDVAEMADFCTFLAEDALKLAVRERHHVQETIERLLGAYVDERDASEHFYAIPEVLANGKLPKWVRDLASEQASETLGRTDEQRGWLTALAKLAPRTSA